jgi:hypothetical protein
LVLGQRWIKKLRSTVQINRLGGGILNVVVFSHKQLLYRIEIHKKTGENPGRHSCLSVQPGRDSHVDQSICLCWVIISKIWWMFPSYSMILKCFPKNQDAQLCNPCLINHIRQYKSPYHTSLLYMYNNQYYIQFDFVVKNFKCHS